MDPALSLEIEEISKSRKINEVIAKGGSTIQSFYEDAVVFVTGGSGFLGKHLIEKLLRACNVNKIYILMRPKKKKFIQERLSLIVEDAVFDSLRKIKPDFASKLEAIPGDVQELGLGICDKDRERLMNEVNIIFHIAATVSFNEPLRKATLINVRGTREVLALGQACKHLKVYIHVSTAYAPATMSRSGKPVLEQFYPTPIPPQTLIEFAEHVSESRLNNITKALIEDWPNTYTFTKTVSEDLVRSMEGKMPIVVVRPAVVTGALYEPSPGWIDKNALVGANGIFLGSGLGLLQVFFMDGNTDVSIIPVDIVTNATIAAAQATGQDWQNDEKKINIYLIVSKRNPLLLRDDFQIKKNECSKIPSDKMMNFPWGIMISNRFLFQVCQILFHFIPGLLGDCVLQLLGKKPMLYKLYQKANKLTDAQGYFCRNTWLFKDDNLVALIKNMEPDDKIIFSCDITDLNWKQYLVVWWLGLRKYAIKDGLKNTKHGLKKYKLFKLLNYVLVPLYFYSLYKIVCFFFYIFLSVVLYFFNK